MDLRISDDALLRDCRVDLDRGGGPGGQKRNKTSNRVRLVHRPTGTLVVAGEDRSLRVNKLRALRRLRLRLACGERRAIDPVAWTPPDWMAPYLRGGQLHVNASNPHHPAVAAVALDLLLACRGDPSAAAATAGVSLRSYLKFLAGDSQVWNAANAVRARMGEPALNKAS